MYVYRHRRLDTNEIFYIGIGSRKDRCSTKLSRNAFWWNIINKTKWSVEILAGNLSLEDACELEILLIQEYGRRDRNLGPLVNMTDGGDIRTNFDVSQETRDKISKIHKGRKHSKEHIEKRLKSNKQTKKIINTETGEIFYGIRIISNLLNMNYQTLCDQLRGKHSNKTVYKYLENYG